MKRNIYYLTGPYAEILISLSMLNDREMQRVKSKDRNSLRTFSSLAPDIKDCEMKRSKYSSKYSFCLYYLKTYDLRNLDRDTWFEYRMMAARHSLIRLNCMMADDVGNIYRDRLFVPRALFVLTDAFSLIDPSTSNRFDMRLLSENERNHMFVDFCVKTGIVQDNE